jgi:hypothetical protein
MFNKTLAVLGLFGWSVFASASAIPANAINLDTQQNNTATIFHSASAIAFTDVFSFTVPSTSLGQAAAVALDLSFLNLLNISGLKVSQDESSPNTINFFQIAIATTAAGVVEPSAFLSIGLNPGQYVFDVSGIANGTNGGGYTANYSLTLSSPLTAVPLPPTFVMFASGLLGLGALRKKVQV